jgi:hypothetical protein
LAYRLYSIRNYAAHAEHSDRFKFEHVARFLSAIIAWLSIPPQLQSVAWFPSLESILKVHPNLKDRYTEIAGEESIGFTGLIDVASA